MKRLSDKLSHNKRENFTLIIKLKQDNYTYLDSAATAQKPKTVIEAVKIFYEQENFPVQRSIYELAEQTSKQIENVRIKIADFLGCQKAFHIIFTASATDAINLVAKSIKKNRQDFGKNAVITAAEHNSNVAPWLDLSPEFFKDVKIIPFPARGFFEAQDFFEILNFETKILSLSMDSNVVGPVWTDNFVELKLLIKKAHEFGILVLLDASQAVAHSKLNLYELDADFLVFSGHKIGGPTGVGILCTKKVSAEWLHPLRLGGGNLKIYKTENSQQEIHFTNLPQKLEAGTLPTAQIIGLGKAIKYLDFINKEENPRPEPELCKMIIEFLNQFPAVSILGNSELIAKNGHIVSFVVAGIHAHDIAWCLDQHKVMVRAGDHCANLLHQQLNYAASIRVSFFIYNNLDDVENFKQAFVATLNFFKESQQ